MPDENKPEETGNALENLRAIAADPEAHSFNVIAREMADKLGALSEGDAETIAEFTQQRDALEESFTAFHAEVTASPLDKHLKEAILGSAHAQYTQIIRAMDEFDAASQIVQHAADRNVDVSVMARSASYKTVALTHGYEVDEGQIEWQELKETTSGAFNVVACSAPLKEDGQVDLEATVEETVEENAGYVGGAKQIADFEARRANYPKRPETELLRDPVLRRLAAARVR